MAAIAGNSGSSKELEQQFCLKWNNHRSTLFSVFDTLLEEESLVDVTLSAEGQFLRAHRVILSACSPYFRNLFKSHYLNDKHPVVFMKDMEFENLKSLVEYMYKGEANVPQHMLHAFIKDAESLQIRGLAECANKQFEAEHLAGASPSRSQQGTPANASMTKKSSNSSKHSQSSALGPGGILAARLAKMNDQIAPPMPFLDFEGFPSMLARNQALMAAAAATSTPLPGLHPPQMKKSRKSTEPRPRGGSPTKEAKKLKLKSNSSLNSSGILAGHAHNLSVPGSGHGPHESTNNNYDDDEVGGLKIDEDADPGKENLENKLGRSDDLVMDSSLGGGGNSEMDHSNGVSEEEEEPSMPGPAGGELAEAATEIINPWTGGKLQLSEEMDENSAQDDTGLVWGSSHVLGDFSETAHHNSLPISAAGVATPTGATPTSQAGSRSTPRLKRLNNAQQHNVYTLCQTAEGAMKFRCTECSRCFNLKCTLLRHVRHQHQGRFVPHPCGQCGQVFKRTDHLKVHMRKIHKITSASRGHRGGSNNNAGGSPERRSGGNLPPEPHSASGHTSAIVAAAVASMANTQPLALTKEEPKPSKDLIPPPLALTKEEPKPPLALTKSNPNDLINEEPEQKIP